MVKRKLRQDYINIQRKLVKILRENHINMQIPYYPDLKLTNQQLADAVGVSERTVRRHRKKMSHQLRKKIEAETTWDVWYRMHG